eukprot:gene3621-7203_t
MADSNNKKGKLAKANIKTFENSLYDKLYAWKEGQDIAKCTEIVNVPDSVFQASSQVVFFPPILSSAERRIVHKLAIRLELYHASFGEGSSRYTCVSKTSDFDGLHTPSHENKSVWYNSTVEKVKRTPLCLSFDEDKLKQIQETMDKIEPSMFSYLIYLNGITDLSSVSSTNDSCKIVDNLASLQDLVTTLSSRAAVAFDCEMHSFRSYYGITCTIQICDGLDDYIVDCLALSEHIAPLLGQIFSSPHIVKVGHGITGGDVPALFRDFGIVIVNAFDTQIGALALGLSGSKAGQGQGPTGGGQRLETDNEGGVDGHDNDNDNDDIEEQQTDDVALECDGVGVEESESGNKKLLVHTTGKEYDPGHGAGNATESRSGLRQGSLCATKEGEDDDDDRSSSPHGSIGLAALLTHFQCPLAAEIANGKNAMRSADWRLRPLTPEMLRYARLDVHYLLPLFGLLVRLLLRSGGAPALGIRALKKQKEAETAATIPTTSPTTTITSVARPKAAATVMAEAVSASLLLKSKSMGTVSSMDDEDGSAFMDLVEVPSRRPTLEAQDIQEGEFMVDVEGIDTDDEEDDGDEDLQGNLELDMLSGGDDDEEDEAMWAGWGEVQDKDKDNDNDNYGNDNNGDNDNSSRLTMEVPVSLAASGPESTSLQTDGTGVESQGHPNSKGFEEKKLVASVEIKTSTSTAADQCNDNDSCFFGLGKISVRQAYWKECLTEGQETSDEGVGGGGHVEVVSTGEALHMDGYHKLARVLLRSQQACARLWTPPASCDDQCPEGAKRLVKTMRDVRRKGMLRSVGRDRWGERNNIALRLLIMWRDAVARERDESPAFLCPADVLVEYAKAMPSSRDEVLRIRMPPPDYFVMTSPSPDGASVDGVQQLLDVINQAREIWQQNQKEKMETKTSKEQDGDGKAFICSGSVDDVRRSISSNQTQIKRIVTDTDTRIRAVMMGVAIMTGILIVMRFRSSK